MFTQFLLLIVVSAAVLSVRNVFMFALSFYCSELNDLWQLHINCIVR